MWYGKNKAFTLSYDDGVESDRKLLDIINYYGLKCTFNLNSGIIGTNDTWQCNKHLAPAELDEEQMYDEFKLDKMKLEKVFKETPVGMAYAYGCYNDKVVEYLKSIGIEYARTVEDSLNFNLQDDLMRFKPTCHHKNDRVFELIDEFLEKPDDKPQLFYLWGHSYEFDAEEDWTRLEQICEKISGYDNIFYGTNSEVLLNKGCK